MQFGQRKSAIALVLVSAVLWGFYWIPVYRLEARGLEGAWAGLSMNAGALAVVALAGLRFARGPVSPRAVAGALLCGAAVSLYATAISFTDVVRAVLLFYLSPILSTAIECLLLGRRWTLRGSLAVFVTGLGLVVVFRGQIPLDGLGAAGDWMAIAAGLSWSIGTSLIFTKTGDDPVKLTIVAVSGALAVSCAIVFIGGASMGSTPSLDVFAGAGWELAALGLLYLVPIVFMSMWSAQRLNPAAMSFLLTAEIISGVGSSALLLDQPFGIFEISGAILIIAGATLEVAATAPRRRQRADF